MSVENNYCLAEGLEPQCSYRCVAEYMQTPGQKKKPFDGIITSISPKFGNNNKPTALCALDVLTQELNEKKNVAAQSAEKRNFDRMAVCPRCCRIARVTVFS